MDIKIAITDKRIETNDSFFAHGLKVILMASMNMLVPKVSEKWRAGNTTHISLYQ